MKTYPPIIARPPRHVRVPAFSPVPLRGRGDGWTAMRQAAFLGALAETGSVVAAARKVGMARETAYRLRGRAGAESFAAAWDKVTGAKPAFERKVTSSDRSQRALVGLLKPVMYGGRHVGTICKPDNSALLSQLAQIDRALAESGEAGGGARKSQSFTPPRRSTFDAGIALFSGEKLTGRLPDTPGRSRTGGPFPGCTGAGPTSGTRR
ncbi:MAG: hypothetical protein JWQ16_3368 [Novosphingobium sp.]|nr:hypothetical protein [Novosphingobium sp.]